MPIPGFAQRLESQPTYDVRTSSQKVMRHGKGRWCVTSEGESAKDQKTVQLNRPLTMTIVLQQLRESRPP